MLPNSVSVLEGSGVVSGPIKRIVLFPVHLEQFSWVGRRVFLFFILYDFACKIHGVRGKNSDLTY